MEGLIPFLYKAFVMYKRERRFSSILFNDHHSPSTAGYYTRLLEDSSVSSGPSDLRRLGPDRLGILETKSSPTR
ncbi:hypothetical protein Bca4012_016023 [Brassica carinata]|uniref:Uncharacterized protein n=1 Tax=Brassica carinata TaxID=52824 RepID=A0A8X7WSS0_BRACI|nr:hypothetical protein Bca52824_006211 [Brassica carinata]